MPAVVNTFLAQVKPGGFERGLEMLRRAAKPLERAGGKNIRVFRGATGETYGSLLLVMEYASMKDYGVAYDRIMKDDEVVSMIAASDAADSPYATQTIAVSNEIPIGTTPKPGPVLQVAISRPVPGRFEDAVALGAKVGQVLGKTGASARLFQTGIGGLQSGTFALSMEFANMAALGQATDAIMDGPEGQALVAEVNGANSPVTMVSMDIFTEITL